MQALCCPVAASLPSCSKSPVVAQQLSGSIHHRALSSRDTSTGPPDVESEVPEDTGNHEAEQDSAEAALERTVQEKELEVRWFARAHSVNSCCVEAINTHFWVQLANYKDKLVRLLADMENLRDRTNRQAEQARSFAIQVHLCHTLSPKYLRLYRPALMSVVILISLAEMHAVRSPSVGCRAL